MHRRKLIVTAVLALSALAASGVAEAQKIRVGDLILPPTAALPRPAAQARKRADHDPRRRQDLDRLGQLPADPGKHQHRIRPPRRPGTFGLPTCTERKLEATTVPQARKACPGAIVGKGYGHAVVAFPESKPINVDSPITLFNGPKKGGNPTVIAHAYTTYPAPVALLVPVVIEKIHKGVYGYRTKAKIPRIAGGAGIPISGHLTIGRKWTYKGKKHSYVNARCETGHLQARVEATFKDKTFLSGVFIRACQVRK